MLSWHIQDTRYFIKGGGGGAEITNYFYAALPIIGCSLFRITHALHCPGYATIAVCVYVCTCMYVCV